MPKLSSRPPSGPCSDPRCNDPRCFAATTRLSTEPLVSTRQGGSAFYRDLPPPINSGRTVNDEHFLAWDGGYGRRSSIYSSFINSDIRRTPIHQRFQIPRTFRRSSTGVYGSSPMTTAPSFRPVRDTREREWMEDNKASTRSMGIEETAKVEDEGGDPHGYPPATSEHRRKHHQRTNDYDVGTDNLRSRHGRGERSTGPRGSQRKTYSDEKEHCQSTRRHHRCPSSSQQQSTSKCNQDEINIIVDDKTIIIFQNGTSARISMGDLPPGEDGGEDDEIYNDRATADRVNKWMAENGASYAENDQSTLLALPAPPTASSSSHCDKAPISAASRPSRSYRPIPLKYYAEDTERPTDITFYLDIPVISAASSKHDWVNRAMAPVGPTIDEEFVDLSSGRRDRLVAATWQHMDDVYEQLVGELTESRPSTEGGWRRGECMTETGIRDAKRK